MAQNAVSFHKREIPRSGKLTKCALLAIFISKLLAARKTMPMLAKINALLACSQRPFVTVLLIQRKLFSYDAPKVSNFTSGGVQNRETKNRALGTIVTAIQDFSRKTHFSVIFL